MELLIVVAFWLLTLGAAIWALVTLSRIRAGQEEILTRRSAIERRLLNRS